MAKVIAQVVSTGELDRMSKIKRCVDLPFGVRASDIGEGELRMAVVLRSAWDF